MLKILSKSADTKEMKLLAKGILMSKLEYGADIGALAPEYMLKKLQSIQLKECAQSWVLQPNGGLNHTSWKKWSGSVWASWLNYPLQNCLIISSPPATGSISIQDIVQDQPQESYTK